MYNYDPLANTDDGSCIPYILGCLDGSACNYDPLANTEDGSCVYQELYYDCNGDCLNDSNANGVCDEIEPTISVNTDTLFYSVFVSDTYQNQLRCVT